MSAAITEYLEKRPDGATIAEIQIAVEARLGGTVAPSSVRASLNKNEGKLFKRIVLGRYRLL